MTVGFEVSESASEPLRLWSVNLRNHIWIHIVIQVTPKINSFRVEIGFNTLENSMFSVVSLKLKIKSGNYGNANIRISLKRSTFVVRVELFWRKLARNMTVCPKYEIAFGSDTNANR